MSYLIKKLWALYNHYSCGAVKPISSSSPLSLQDLRSKFSGIIVPEGLRYSQQEESSVLATISCGSDVISAAGVPPHQLLGEGGGVGGGEGGGVTSVER